MKIRNIIIILLTILCICLIINVSNNQTECTNTHIDTSAIELWDGNFPNGNIRMLSGYYDGEYLIDETGEAWEATELELKLETFYLLWILDNKTPEDKTDDILFKVWEEI